MSVDWRMALPNTDNLATAFQRGQDEAIARKREQEELELKRKLFARSLAQQDQMLAMAREGDDLQAARMAYALGNNKAGDGFRQTGGASLERTQAANTAYANIATGVASLPYEQRRSAIQSVKPRLVAMGMNPAEIDAFDPTDANLAAILGIDYSVEKRTEHANDRYSNETDRLEANKPVTISAGESLVTQDGQELYRAPEYKAFGIDENVYEVGGTGSNGYVTTTVSGGLTDTSGTFDGAMSRLWDTEGGYANDPDDSGGETMFGITKAVARENGYNGNMRDLPRAKAQEIYQTKYWNPVVRAGVPPAYREAVFDFGVNAGVQRSLELWRQSGGDIRKFNQLRIQHYRSLPNYDKFGRGWERRVARTTPSAASVEVQAVGSRSEVQGQRSTQGSLRQIQQGRAKPTGKPKKEEGRDQNSIDSFDRAIRSGEELLAHPGLKAAIGSGFDPSSYGSINPLTGEPFAGTDAAGFMARLSAMKSQVFLPMVQQLRGMGALSENEGKKLTDAIGALDPTMPEKDFIASMRTVISDLKQYRARAMRGGSSSGSNAPVPVRNQREAMSYPSGTIVRLPDGRLKRVP